MQHLRSPVFLITLFVVAGIRLTSALQAQESPGEVIYISKNDEMIRAQAPETEEVLFKNQLSKTVIEWGLSHARVTVLLNGTFSVSGTVRIPVSNTALVVGPDAELKAGPDARLTPLTEGHGIRTPLILNQWKNDVSIINLGTLDAGGKPEPGEKEVSILFDGRNGGTSGIKGGLIFLPGKEVRCSNKAVYVIDSERVRIPLIINASHSNGATTFEGNENCTIGTVAALAGENAGENEAVDLNSYNKGLDMDTIIGTSPSEQILDINNSPRCIAQNVVGYGDPDGMTLVSMPQYPPGGRRLTQKSHIDHSKGSAVREQRVVEKEVTDWRRELDVKNFPDGLPDLNVRVTLTAEFKDGSEEIVFERNVQENLKNTRN